ncbi:hypothetical protein CLV71_1501 [Actinophytocola oryzae]|uniref:Uncharacterized protein n=1 Tax=Actinophytocola oryzae TaxID=502181 RepID=A0A4R7UQ82_9PSEU|nr:hypothetical protein CLV71_1501 [Actinophytocola oryzae]
MALRYRRLKRLETLVVDWVPIRWKRLSAM